MGYTRVMALYVNKDQKRSELQERLDAELRAKLAARSKQEHDRPDGVEDSAYIKGTKQTSSIAWAWLAIVIAMIVLFIIFIYMANTV